MTTAASPGKTAAASPVSPTRLRLDYLDGARGLAALYVALHHVAFGVPLLRGEHWSAWANWLVRPLAFGHFAVDVFIVLSGYCLMLPVVRDNGVLRGGTGGFLKRRARRILLPYYAAMGVSLLLLWARQRGPDALRFSPDVGAWWPSMLLSHLVLAHNLSWRWAYGIDVPLWSVATEWQIYFFFPLLLLPLWRRAGWAVTAAAAFALGFLPHALLPPGANGDQACPWFLGLFALGAAAAQWSLAAKPQAKATRALWAVPGALAVALLLLRPHWSTARPWLVDPLVGLTVAAFLMWATQTVRAGRTLPGAARVLQAPATVRLGEFSYSLYLVHYPLLLCFYGALRLVPLAPDARLALMLFVWAPLCILCAYGFHLLFERRLLSPVARAAERPDAHPVTLLKETP